MKQSLRLRFLFQQVLLILSACALFLLNARSISMVKVLPLSMIALFFWTKYDRRVIERRPRFWAWNLFFTLVALGICLAPMAIFQNTFGDSKIIVVLQNRLGIEASLLVRSISVILVVAAMWFAFCAVRYFYALLLPIAKDIAADFQAAEFWFIAGVSAILMVAVAALYLRTNAFAHPVLECDLLYSSDSGACINYLSYFRIGGVENDIRSPLFALFTAPFLSIPYLLSFLLPFGNAQAMVLTMAQVPIHVVTWYLLIKMIPNCNLGQRLSLLVLALASYSGFLFSFFPEQYIIATFWIALFLYRLIRHNRREDYLIIGAAGTMITSAALAFLTERTDHKPSLGSTIKTVLLTGVKGLGALFAFGCLDVLLSYQHVTHLFSYTNVSGSFLQKLMQYFAHVSSTFFAANAGPIVMTSELNEWKEIAVGKMVWHELPVTALSIAGVILFALALVGFLLNRKQILSKVSLFLVLLSFAVICLFGWGTSENGMFLYTKYFGWAFFILLVLLMQKFFAWLHMEKYTAPVYLAAAVGLALYNLPQIKALLDFAITYYPA
ncbi:MAG: hypothetical protein PHW41_01730 [Eubacteriales bacterium]|nr:hypothetical protein [Eubacteriales bacterium]